MNYIGCFNRSRAANNLQPVFFRSWCASMLPGVEYCRRAICAFLVRLNAARCGVLPVHPLRRSWCASMLPGVDVLPPCPFAPFLAPQCCQVWSIAAVPFAPSWCASMLPGVECCPLHHFAPSWCLDAARCGVLPVAPLRRSWCASMVPTLLRYTYYSISQILEILQRCPHSWQLVIDFIAYHRDQGIVNKCK